MANDYSINAQITADASGYEKGINKAVKASKSLSSTLATVGLALNGVTAIFNTVGKAISVVSKTATQCTQAFKVQINAEKALDTAVRNSPLMNGESTKNLKQFASSMQAVTNYGDEVLLPLITQLTTAGRSEEQAMKIIRTATDIASSGAMSLDTAVTQLNATLNGNVGKLGQQNKELKNLTAQELENGKAVDILAQKYKGMAQTVADPTTQLKNLVGDLKEEVGSKLMPTVQLFASEAIKSVQKLISLVDNLNFNKVTAFFKVIADETKAMATSGAEKLMGLFSNMRDVFSSLAESDGFKKALKIVNTIIDAYAFLYSQVATVFVELGNRVKDFAENVWEVIKRLFTSSGEALDDSTDALSSWGNVFYNIFNNMFKQAQDVIYSITALIKGDWSLAWEYMKLACARVADSILDILSNIVNAFPKMIENIVNFLNDLIEKANQVRKWFGGDGQWDKIQAPKKADFSKSSGLDKYITDTEKKISELTGKQADKNIKDIDRFTEKAGKKLSEFSASFSAKVKKAEGEIAGMGKHFVEAVSTTTDGGAGGKKTIGEYIDEIVKKLKALPTTLKNLNIKDLITRDFETIKNGVINFIPNLKDKLKEEIEEIKNLTFMPKTPIENVVSIFKAIRENNKKRKQNEKETGKETEKIYKKVYDRIKSITQDTFNLIKSAFENFSKIIKSFGNMLNKAFELNLDDSIVQLLKYEDKILTFFIETVPKLPQFVASAIQSISTMFQTLNANVDKGTIATVISEMITNLAIELPSLISNLWGLISKVANGIVEGLNAGMPAIKEFGKTLPETINGIITDVTSNFGNFEELLNGITDVFETFVTSLADNDIFADLGNLFSKILTTIVNSIDKLLPSIEKALDEIIPALGKFITDSIPSIVNLLIDVAILIVKEVPKILSELIKALPVIVEALLEALPKFFDEGLPELIAGFIQIIPDIIKAGVQITVELIKHLPEIIGSFIKGLVLGFAQVNWWEVIKSIFQAFIDGFKELFGIHSPSTVFRDFGKNIWQGLMNGLKGIGEWFTGIFTKAIDGIKTMFGNLKNWFSDLWDKITGKTKQSTEEMIREQKIASEMAKGVSREVAERIVDNNPIEELSTDKFKVYGVTKVGYANGSQAVKRGLAVVGEAGPELVRFRGGEQVLNAKNTQKALSSAGTSNSFNVTFNNLQDTTAFALMQQLKQYNRQMAINGII